MIIIIHGEDITKSRKYFLDQKSRHKDSITVNGVTVTLTEMMQIFEGNELFATEKYVFIEEFFSKRRKSRETEQILEIIKSNQTQATVFFWESKDITPSQLKHWSKPVIHQFKLPQTIFALLDSFKPNNGKNLIQLFHKTIVDEETQFIFSMIIRQFRLLLAFSQRSTEAIEEMKRMSLWQRNKLEKQATLFSRDQLKNAYTELYRIEYGIKTGTLHVSLEQAIDFFLLRL